MNGHAGSAVPAQAGPSKLKPNGILSGNGVNGGSTGNGPMNVNESGPSPSPSHASTVHVPLGGNGSTGPLSGASPYFQPAAVNMNYNSPQSAQMMGGYAYYHPQQQQQQQQQQHQQHPAYSGYPPAGGSYPMRMPSGASANGVNGNVGYARQNSYHHQQQQQQQGHFQQQQQHMPSYDYNAHMHHAASNAAGPSRYQGYSPYNPYYPQPVYAHSQQGPAIQASPYPVYQPSGGAYPGAQPMYYDPSMYYQPPTASGRPPYNYMHQGANGPYPYVMPTPDMSHPMSTPLQPQTPSSSHVSPYPTSQLPQATISNPPPPPPRESDQPPQPPPPIVSEAPAAETGTPAVESNSMPVFASVMRSTVTIKKDERDEKDAPAKEEKGEDRVTDRPEPAVREKGIADEGESIAGSREVEVAQPAESSPGEVDDKSAPPADESEETVAPGKVVEIDGFSVDADQTYLHGRGRPVDQAEAPAVLFSSRLSPSGDQLRNWTAWSGQVESVHKTEQLESAISRRPQSRVLTFARKGDRSGTMDASMQFGEVDASMIAESTRFLQERAKQAKTAAVSASAKVAEPIVSEPAEPISTEAAPTEPLSTPAPASSSPAPPAPAVRAAPKSWAALLRPSVSAPAKASDGARSTSGSAEPPTGESASAAQAVPAEGGGKPVKPIGYAAAAAAGSASRSGELDLAKLLSEGVGGLPLSAGAAGLASVPRGLINTGNMCFANSIMQVLAYCNPFNILLQELSKRIKADLGGRTRLLEAMMLFLREFAAAEMGDSEPNGSGVASDKAIPASAKPEKVTSGGIAKSGEAFVPTYVYEAMRENKRFDTMRRGHQEDAEEFMGFFLETLHEELLYLVSRHESRTARGPRKDTATTPNKMSDDASEEREVTRPVSPSAGRDDGWLEVGKNQKLNVVRTTTSRESAISKIFGGKLRSVLRTPGQKDSVTLEPYQPLQLDISAPNVHTITEALLHLNEPETISGVYSASRGTNVDATKTVYLETVPPILTLHLKRFLYDPVENRVVKKGKAVAYGPELIIPTSIISPARRPAGGELRYRLFGVVYHHGSTATGGHYTACVLKQDGKGWLHLDDELVENVEGDAGVYVTRDAAVHGDAGTVGRSMRSKCAYLLFYARV